MIILYIWNCYLYLCLDSTGNESCTYNNNNDNSNNIFNIAIIMWEDTPTRKALGPFISNALQYSVLTME